MSIAPNSRRRQGERLRALFTILAQHPEGLPAQTAIEQTQQSLTLLEGEEGDYETGPKFPKLLRFSTIDAVKAGWLIKDNGTWTLTDEGRASLDRFPDDEALFQEASRLYHVWRRDSAADDVPGAAGPHGTPPEEPAEVQAAITVEESLDVARTQLLDYLGRMPPYDFQNLVGKLLAAMGYYLIWTAPKGPDGGLDLIAQVDRLGVSGPLIRGQVKRRQDKARTDELRAFRALVGEREVGLFISLSGFTKEAEDESRVASQRVTLISGPQLLDLWEQHFEKVDVEGRQLLPIRPVYYLDLPS